MQIICDYIRGDSTWYFIDGVAAWGIIRTILDGVPLTYPSFFSPTRRARMMGSLYGIHGTWLFNANVPEQLKDIYLL